MPPTSRKAGGAARSSASSSSGGNGGSRRAAPAPVSPSSQARLGLLSGLIEGTMVVMELMFGLSIVKAACMSAYKTVNGLSAADEPPAWNQFCMHLAANLVVMAWLLFRIGNKHQPALTIANMANKLRLWPLPRSLGGDSLRMLATVFTLHFVGTAAMAGAQYLTGRWLFSFNNYKKGDEIDWIASVDMLALAPLREELTFRGLMFAIFYMRGVAFKLVQPSTSSSSSASQSAGVVQESWAWTSSWKLDCVAASAISFGLVHLLNLFGDKYTRTYIILQVLLGMTIGSFYAMRFLRSQNALLETVILHAINNIFSSFLPVDAELDLSDPLVAIPLCITFVVYGSLAFREAKQLLAMKPQPFGVLLDTPPAITDEATASSSASSSSSSEATDSEEKAKEE